MSRARRTFLQLLERNEQLLKAEKRIKELEDLLPHDARAHDITSQKNEDYRTRLKSITLDIYDARQEIAELVAENSKLQGKNFAQSELIKTLQEFPELTEPTRETRLARTVVRITKDFDGSLGDDGPVEACIPSWDPNATVIFSSARIPLSMRGHIRKDNMFFAKVNTGASGPEDLHFADFEIAPEPIFMPTVFLTPEGQKIMDERAEFLKKACEAEDGCISVGGLAHEMGMLEPEYIEEAEKRLRKEAEKRLREDVDRMHAEMIGEEHEYDLPGYKDALHDADLRVSQLEKELLDLHEFILERNSFTCLRDKDWLDHATMSIADNDALNKLVKAGRYERHPSTPDLFRRINDRR